MFAPKVRNPHFWDNLAFRLREAGRSPGRFAVDFTDFVPDFAVAEPLLSLR